jgi:hypothetical protein
VWRFGFPAVASDEPTYSVAAWRYIHGDHALPPSGGATNAHNFEHPPLAKLLFGLAQLPAGHPSIPADRLVAATCTLATALIIGVWIGHAAGRWTGLLAAMLVAGAAATQSCWPGARWAPNPQLRPARKLGQVSS